MNTFRQLAAMWAWQSRAVLMRHIRVHLRKWHIVLLPPVFEPLILLVAFGVGLGGRMGTMRWEGHDLAYLAYLAPGMLAYTAFMQAFFQSIFSAYVRMHYQKAWDGQLATQVRLEHVVWAEALWAAGMATVYTAVICLVLLGFGAAGMLSLHWWWLPAVLPLLFLAALAWSWLGLLFTATLPSMDHMGLPFFLVVMPLGFASSTYFPMPDAAWAHALTAVNPLHHLAEGVRHLLVAGEPTWHLGLTAAMSLAMITILAPLDMRLLRRRVFGDG